MGGRLSRIGGEWFIWPAYWQGPSFTFDDSSLVGPLQWMPTRSFKDLINRVNGTYIAPNYPYNVAGNLYDSNGYYNGMTADNWPFAFQPTNFPQYAADVLHGYASDQYLNEDSGVSGSWSSTVTYAEGAVILYSNEIYISLQNSNLNNNPATAATWWEPYSGQLPKELTLSTVLSIAQAQRVAKIMLLRNRFQGMGNFPLQLACWQMQPTDVMQFTFAAAGWTDKVLEVDSLRFRIDTEGGGGDEDKAPRLYIEATMIETDTSVYEWSTVEELNVYDVPSMPAQTPYVVAPPTSVTLTSGASTAIIGGDGVVRPRVLVEWMDPLDIQVTQIQIQFQLVGAGSWTDGGTVAVGLGEAFVEGVIAGQQYNFQVRSLRYTGATSVWEQVNNYTVSITISTLGQVGLDPDALTAEGYSGGTASIFVAPFTAVIGNFSESILPAGSYQIMTDSTIGGGGGNLQQSTLYYVYYYDPTFAGGAITPKATTNPADFTGPSKVGNFLIGAIVTPIYVSGGGGGGGTGTIYRPSNSADQGTRTTTSQSAAYDGNMSSCATVSALQLELSPPAVPSHTFGQCMWEDFPAATLSAAATLNVSLACTIPSTGGSGTVTISAMIGGSLVTLATLTASAAQTTYTATVPSGTNLSTLTVTIEAQVVDTAGTPSNALTLASVYEIWVQ